MEMDMTESEFQQRVIHEAQLAGWRVYHTYDSRRSAAGYPDLTLVRPPRVIVAELKSERGHLSRAQREWLDAFRATPVEAYLWFPRDAHMILAILE